MPARRVPRLSSLVGSIGAALVLAAALAPVATPAAHAQDGGGAGGPMMGGPGMGPMSGPGMGPMMGGPGPGPLTGGGGDGYAEISVPGQIQYCREQIGTQTNAWAFFPSTSGTYNVFPPYGGTWGFYTGIGAVCRWQPH
jgi:hypothetical protein